MIGAAAGGTLISLVLFALEGADRAAPSYANALFLGGFAGLAAAAGVAWTIARMVDNVFRRAMVAMVALGGAAFVGAMTIVVHAAAGRYGLLGLAGACIAVMVVVHHRLLRP
jgi:hypothetical protein